MNMSTPLFIMLILLIVTALCFDFTNGFHDTGNAMATSIATGALKPKTAVGISAILNLVGAFLSVNVALTVTKNVLKIQGGNGQLVTGLSANKALLIIFAGLVGGIIWNLLTWLFGLPSSSSHALFGGLIGSGIAAAVTVDWNGVVAKVILPALVSPFIAGLIAAISTFLIYAITKGLSKHSRDKGFKYGQIVSASLVSLAHGTGDAQKTMGVISLALVAAGQLNVNTISKDGIPVWVIFICAAAIALGTYIGGWRVIRTLGKGLVEIEPAQGLAAEAASSAIILTSSAAGMALSTTHVATGAILGSGVGKRGAEVRWMVAARLAIAWILTLPAAGIVGAIAFEIAELFGEELGSIVIFILLVALATFMWLKSRSSAVTSSNVNEEWDGFKLEEASPSNVLDIDKDGNFVSAKN